MICDTDETVCARVCVARNCCYIYELLILKCSIKFEWIKAWVCSHTCWREAERGTGWKANVVASINHFFALKSPKNSREEREQSHLQSNKICFKKLIKVDISFTQTRVHMYQSLCMHTCLHENRLRKKSALCVCTDFVDCVSHASKYQISFAHFRLSHVYFTKKKFHSSPWCC